MATETTKWWENYGNLIALANALYDDGALTGASEAIAFFEKPWKWTREHERLAAGKPVLGDDDGDCEEETEFEASP
jgi:hypothetical protein